MRDNETWRQVGNVLMEGAEVRNVSPWIANAVLYGVIGFLAAGALYFFGAGVQILIFANFYVIFPIFGPMFGGPNSLGDVAIQIFSDAGPPFIVSIMVVGVAGSLVGMAGSLAGGAIAQQTGNMGWRVIGGIAGAYYALAFGFSLSFALFVTFVR